MAAFLIHRYRGLAVLVRSYRIYTTLRTGFNRECVGTFAEFLRLKYCSPA